MKLIVGTQNKGKQKEFAELLSVVTGLEVLFPQDFTELKDLDPEETGSSFQEIAKDKARAFADKVTVAAVSDDSGLCVSALGDKPGIHSKRFFSGSDQDRNKEIIRLLSDKENRSAYFISVLALYDPSTKETHFFEGKVDGTIAYEGSGNAGFGYDPIFIPDGYENSFASLGQDVKNELSHRARAIQKLVDYLQSV